MLWCYLPLEALAVLLGQQALGFAFPHAVLAFVVIASLTILLVALPDIQVPRWPREATARPDGARDQVSSLSWAFMTRDELVSARGVRAVQEAATVRLALHGVDLADPAHAPAARELVGTSAYTLLTQSTTTPTMAQLGRCIDRLAAIEPPARAPAVAHAPTPVTDLHRPGPAADIGSTAPDSTARPQSPRTS